ncbi:hypothetical protein BDR22DRAFT_885432 [Usnea florida]
MEAMRRENMSLTHKDFWSRMPSRINVGTEQFPTWRELGSPDITVNWPMERFRYQAGLSSWTERTKTLVVKEGLQKLYGNFIQNNSVRAFGRDIFPEEAKEIKKGKEAVFPIDLVHEARGAQKGISNSASEEKARRPLRSRKKGCQGSERGSIAVEGNDWVMFDNHPFIIDRTDGQRRNPLRSNRDAKLSGMILSISEPSDESSTDEEYEDTPTQRYSARTRRFEATRHSESIEDSPEEDSAETEDVEISDHKSAFERIPRARDFGGKNKGPSCISSTNKPRQRKELGTKGQGAQCATFEGSSSNEPAHRAGVLDVPLRTETQTPKMNGASLEQNVSSSSLSYASEATMNRPFFKREYPEEERVALLASRKRQEDPDKDKDEQKRLRTGELVLPLSAAAKKQKPGNVPPQATSRWPVSPRLNPHRSGHPSRAPPAPHVPSSKTREQQLATESAEIPEPPITALGSEPVDYSTIPPSNSEEVQSLIDALSPTREVYYVWTGQPAPRTDPQQSYRAQFEIILGAFQDWWGAHRAREPLPILIGVMHWGRSVDDWEPTVKDSIYYEAYRMDNRVRREDKGQSVNLLDWTGDSLELAIREMSCGDDRFG